MNKSEDFKLNIAKHEVSKERRRKIAEMATILMKELLFTTKTNYQAMSYADLGKALGGIERSKIFRYANKQNLPPLEIAIKTINYVIENRNMLENLISSNIVIHYQNSIPIIDGTKMLSDTKVLQMISFLSVYMFFNELKIDKILTSEVDGLPIAYAFAYELGIPCLYARKRQPIAVDDYLAVPLQMTSSRQERLYIPSEGLREGERIMIIDDIIRSGKTQKALIDITEKARAEVVSLLALIGVNKNYEKILAEKSKLLKVIIEI